LSMGWNDPLPAIKDIHNPDYTDQVIQTLKIISQARNNRRETL
jgi:hypothetical protein